MSVKVCKFGGTSTADAEIIKSVKRIIESDDTRRFIVVSAPGKRYFSDTKITDLLLACHREFLEVGNCNNSFSAVRSRFLDIVRQLELTIDFVGILDATLDRIVKERSEQFTASRGEYLCAILLAEYFGMKFIDAEDIIYFNNDGSLNADKTYEAVAYKLSTVGKAVIPGFYGVDESGRIRTFSRGGSDISGAIVARAVNATLYENWTDVSGFLACDPQIVANPVSIETMTYRELRKLSYMGANVLHGECISHVSSANVPIQIKNAFRPSDIGTTVIPNCGYRLGGRAIAGISGKKDFTVISIEKPLINWKTGFAKKVLSALEAEDICVEHISTGIDTISLFIKTELSEIILDAIAESIKREIGCDTVRVINDIALIAVVGNGITSSVDTCSRLFRVIKEADISLEMLDWSSSDINILVGVNNEDYERCIEAIYSEFFAS